MELSGEQQGLGEPVLRGPDPSQLSAGPVSTRMSLTDGGASARELLLAIYPLEHGCVLNLDFANSQQIKK